MFGFLKKKEYERIAILEKKVSDLSSQLSDVTEKMNAVSSENFELSSQLSDITERMNAVSSENMELSQYKHIHDLDVEISKREDALNELQAFGDMILEDLDKRKSEKSKAIQNLDEEILLQEFGLYAPTYSFANSELYKERLLKIREQQKEMIKDKTAAKCYTTWTVDNNVAKGRAMTNQNIKQILRCFNDECDVLISNVKFSNINAYIEKIKKSKEILERINSSNSVYISTEYLELKIEELKLAYEYVEKRKMEKDEQKRLRELQREEVKVQKEIEEARRELYKEKKHYENALQNLNEQISNSSQMETDYLLERRTELERKINEITAAISDIDYREANKKAGYVYVISNIGSFGEGVYKIGMTRRLNPMDRVDELGDASVPFKFDVHAMIFSDNAPQLEASLHRAFEDKRVNMVNSRREFFKVSLEDIERVVHENYDKVVDFTKTPQAEQYRETVRIKEQSYPFSGMF